MKKVLLCLFALLLTISLTACDTKQEEPNNNKQQNTSKKEENKNENYIVDDDEILEPDDEDNAPPSEGKVVVEKVINCSGCVYAYFDTEGDAARRIGDTLSSSDYTTDINNLKTKGGKQRHNFFGLVLSGNTISKAYACILKDNKIYCIQGSGDGAYHQNNIAILNQVYTAGQCRTISAGHTYTCTDGKYNGDTKTNGFVSFLYETGCTIYGNGSSNSGKLICH